MKLDEFVKKYQILEPEADKALWLEARRTGITGTDIAATSGLNPHKKVYDVFLDKLGLVDEDADNPFIRRGRRMEPVLVEDYEEMAGLKTVKVGLVRHPEHSFVLGTPDRLVVDEDGNILHGLEVKTANARQAPFWGPPETDIIPDQYLLQCQWYMLATDIKRWDVIVSIGGELPQIYHVEFNEELCSKLLNIAEQFWNDNVLKKDPPSADASESAAKMLAKLYRKADLDLIEAGQEEDSLVSSLMEKKEELEKLQEEVRLLENKLKERIGDHEGLKGGGWIVTWKKTKDRQTVKYDELVKELQVPDELIKKYTATIEGHRVFRVTTTR